MGSFVFKNIIQTWLKEKLWWENTCLGFHKFFTAKLTLKKILNCCMFSVWSSLLSLEKALNKPVMNNIYDFERLSMCSYSFPFVVFKLSLTCRKFSQPSLYFVLPGAHIMWGATVSDCSGSPGANSFGQYSFYWRKGIELCPLENSVFPYTIQEASWLRGLFSWNYQFSHHYFS